MSGLIENDGYIFVAAAAGAETYRILTEGSDNLAAENGDILRREQDV